MPTNVLAISYAKRLLVPGSRERERAEKYARELGQYVVIVFTRKSEGHPSVQKIRNLTIYATNSANKLFMLYGALVIAKKALTQFPETKFVISSQDPFESSLVARFAKMGTKHKHLIQVHGDVFNKDSYRGSLLQQVRVWYGRWVLKKADSIRVVSERIKQSVVDQGIKDSKITVLPIYADLTELIELGRQRLSIGFKNESPLRLLFIGRLAPEKNLKLLLQACKILKNIDFDFHLRIIGDGPEKNNLQNTIGQFGLDNFVTLAPWSESVAEELASADVFCLTSKHEGWGMVLQEAAAAGVVVVTTDVGCVGELLMPDHSALVVSNNDNGIEEIVRAIKCLQDTKVRYRIASEAYAQVRKKAMTEQQYISEWAASHC